MIEVHADHSKVSKFENSEYESKFELNLLTGQTMLSKYCFDLQKPPEPNPKRPKSFDEINLVAKLWTIMNGSSNSSH